MPKSNKKSRKNNSNPARSFSTTSVPSLSAKSEVQKAQGVRVDSEIELGIPEETVKLFVNGSNVVVFGAGLQVSTVVPGTELSKIIVRGLPQDLTEEDVSNAFLETGVDDASVHVLPIFFKLDKSRSEDVVDHDGSKVAQVLMRMEKAKEVMRSFDSGQFVFKEDHPSVTFELTPFHPSSYGHMSPSLSADTRPLTILWPKPSISMLATYDSVETAESKVRELNNKVISGGRRLSAFRPTGKCVKTKGWSESSVIIRLALANSTSTETATHNEIEKLAACPDPSQCHLEDVTNVQTPGCGTNYDLARFTTELEHAILRPVGACVVGNSLEISSVDADRMRATVQYTSRGALERAVERLKSGDRGGAGGLYVPGIPDASSILHIIVPSEYNFFVSVPMTQYQAQREQWEALVQSTKGRGKGEAFVRVSERRNIGHMGINVEGSSLREVGALKVRVEKILASGEALGGRVWDKAFIFPTSKGTKRLFEQVLEETGVYVYVDRRLHELRLYGPNPDAVASATAIIQAEVERLEVVRVDVPIAPDATDESVDEGLRVLKERVGEGKVTLVKGGPAGRRYRMSIPSGSEDAAEEVHKRALEAALSAWNANRSPSHSEEQESTGIAASCALCSKENAPYPELLGCGHTICALCLYDFLGTAAKFDEVPFLCMGESGACKTPISLGIIKRYLSTSKVNRLAEIAFAAYIQSNPRQFKSCPTPDCTQIFLSSATPQVQHCPSCFVDICQSCFGAAHEGLSCQEWGAQQTQAELVVQSLARTGAKVALRDFIRAPPGAAVPQASTNTSRATASSAPSNPPAPPLSRAAKRLERDHRRILAEKERVKAAEKKLLEEKKKLNREVAKGRNSKTSRRAGEDRSVVD